MLIAHYSRCHIHFVEEELLYGAEFDYRLTPPTETPCFSTHCSKSHFLLFQHNVELEGLFSSSSPEEEKLKVEVVGNELL